MAYILGKKIGMTRITNANGKMVPVTLIQAIPNTVHQVKEVEKDGYTAVALSYTGVSKKPKVREFKVEATDGLTKGQEITVQAFSDVEMVNIQGVTKGKGFQGGVKRHNFSTQGETHGVKGKRLLGSIGACASPGRVDKGKKMPGHMGSETKTLKNIPLLDVVSDKNLLVVKGPVPGAHNSLVKVWSN